MLLREKKKYRIWTIRMRTTNQTSLSKTILNARLSRLTETARLLKNVKSVFTRRSNAASRVNVEVELSRKWCYLFNDELQSRERERKTSTTILFVQIFLSSKFIVCIFFTTNIFLLTNVFIIIKGTRFYSRLPPI